MTHGKIFRSNVKLGAALAAGGTLSVRGRPNLERLVYKSPYNEKITLLHVGGIRYYDRSVGYRTAATREKSSPPIFYVPVSSNSLEGAVHEAAAMCEGMLEATLTVPLEAMIKAGLVGPGGPSSYTHTGGIGKSRLVEVLRQQAHLMMEWGEDELLKVVQHNILASKREHIPPEHADPAISQIDEHGRMPGGLYVPSPPLELVKGEGGCFVRGAITSGSIWGHIKIL